LVWSLNSSRSGGGRERKKRGKGELEATREIGGGGQAMNRRRRKDAGSSQLQERDRYQGKGRTSKKALKPKTVRGRGKEAAQFRGIDAEKGDKSFKSSLVKKRHGESRVSWDRDRKKY